MLVRLRQYLRVAMIGRRFASRCRAAIGGFAAVFVACILTCVPAQAEVRVLTLQEGEAANTGFEIAFEGPLRCPAEIRQGRDAGESVVISLDCRNRPGAKALFHLFKGGSLRHPWKFLTTDIRDIDVHAASKVTALSVPTNGSDSPHARIHADAPRGQLALAAIVLKVQTKTDEALPNCREVIPTSSSVIPSDFVCSSDRDCPSTHACRRECGNRCLKKP